MSVLATAKIPGMSTDEQGVKNQFRGKKSTQQSRTFKTAVTWHMTPGQVFATLLEHLHYKIVSDEEV